MPHPSVTNPLTPLAAMHMLDRYHTSQTELRPTFRRAAANELYAMTRVLYGQGVPSRRRSPGFILQAVTDAWNKHHQNGSLKAVGTGDDLPFREVLQSRGRGWLAQWEFDAVNQIVRRVNTAIICSDDDCTFPVMDEHSELCGHHANLQEEQRRNNDAFLRKAVDNILTRPAEARDPIALVAGHEHKYHELPDHRAACSCGAWEQTDSSLVAGVRHAAWVDHIEALKETS